LNSIALSGGIPGKSLGNTSRNSQTTWISSIFLLSVFVAHARIGGQDRTF
jgi:hypothetical protein